MIALRVTTATPSGAQTAGFSIDADPAQSWDDQVCLILDGQLMRNQGREFFFFSLLLGGG